jgi:6-pyruvoyltetrahydropterin/6-carboxytetrahydropterin synthase
MILPSITRRLEFDAGHRLPDHASKCWNIHGHRYALEATLTGTLQKDGAARGMLVDFANLKELMLKIVDEWDHGFLCWEEDEAARAMLALLGPKHRTIILPCTPTVENLATYAYEYFSAAVHGWFLDQHGTRVREQSCIISRVKLWETPNCFAEITASGLIQKAGGFTSG